MAGTATQSKRRAGPARPQAGALQPRAANQRGSRWREPGALALLLAATAWLHRDALTARFFADDFLFLDQVRGRSLWGALLSPDPIGNFFRPLGRQVYFWTFAHLGGERPIVFHAAGLALFLTAIALLYSIVKRHVGARGAIVASAVVALHYSADVPLSWASGGQDLLALTLSLAAIELHARGRGAAAACACFLALSSKEIAIVTPLLAMINDSAPERSLPARARRALPIWAALAAWAVLWLIARGSHAGLQSTPLPSAGGVASSLVHLAQVALGLEWGTITWWSALPALPWVALALAIMAVWIAAPARRPAPNAPGGAAGDAPAKSNAAPAAARERAAWFDSPFARGIAWGVVGALPIAAVAPIWSAYYDLLAMCGVGLAIGARSMRAPRALAGALVLAFGVLSAGARSLDEFATAPGEWTTLSHVNRFYVERSSTLVGRLLDQLRSKHPTLPANTTLFFGGVPANSGWQTTDGPLMRWAYHDPTLRSFYMTQFTRERARRGPVFFLVIRGDSLSEPWESGAAYPALAAKLVLDDMPAAAREALAMEVDSPAAPRQDVYLMAWLDYAAGDTDAARSRLIAAGCVPDAGPAAETAVALRAIESGADTLRVTQVMMSAVQRHALDPAAHALLADLLLARDRRIPAGFVEAYATHLLRPADAHAWRRWAQVLILNARYRQALMALDRYSELGGSEALRDAEANSWRSELERAMPGGDLAQKSLRNIKTGGI